MKFFILLLFISSHIVFGADKYDLQLKNVEVVVLPERLHRDISEIVSILVKDDYFLENYTKSLRIGEDSKKSKSIKELIFNNDQELYYVYTNTVIQTLNPNIKDLNVVRNGQKIRLLDIPIKFESAVSLLGVTSSSVSDIAVTNAVKKYNKLGETKELENIIKNASSNVVNLKFDKMVELNNKFESEYYKDLGFGNRARAFRVPTKTAYIKILLPESSYIKLNEEFVKSKASYLLFSDDFDVFKSNSLNQSLATTTSSSVSLIRETKLCNKPVKLKYTAGEGPSKSTDLKSFIERVKRVISYPKDISERVDFSEVEIVVIDIKFGKEEHNLSKIVTQNTRHNSFANSIDPEQISSNEINYTVVNESQISSENDKELNHGSHLKNLASFVLDDLMTCTPSVLKVTSRPISSSPAGIVTLFSKIT